MAEDFFQCSDILCLAEIERGKGMSADFVGDGFVYASNGCNFLEVSVHSLIG